MIDLLYFRRLEPRARDNDLTRSLAAELRDPLWMLTRQWQFGEFAGRDAGSMAYVTYAGGVAQLPRWEPALDGSERELRQDAPLEAQVLREPFAPDLSLRVELGQDFSDFLANGLSNATQAAALVDAFRSLVNYQIQPLADDDELNPVDPATKRFLMVCASKAVDGFALYNLGCDIRDGKALVPSEVTSDPALVVAIESALADLATRVETIYGAVSDTEGPPTWKAERLEYQLNVVAADPSGNGNATLAAYPDSDGEFEWFSFDVSQKDALATETLYKPCDFHEIPARVRFPGMPASRFWNFEENKTALPDVLASPADMLKLTAIDCVVIHSNDWYRIPYLQEPGTLARTDYILVHDVFGRVTAVFGANSAADSTTDVPSYHRWCLFNPTDDAPSADTPPADYFILPPSAGAAMKLGMVLEDVRFGRDETANMAWAIERITTSPIGEPRSGRERNAEIDARRNPPALPSTGDDSRLRYLVESEVPANFVPLLPILVHPDTSDPSIKLRRGEAMKATTAGTAEPVPVLSKILSPYAGGTYDIQEEEIPRSGLRVERVVCRTRWVDGSVHLWVQRRRSIGAGESQSGLRFDQAAPNEAI